MSLSAPQTIDVDGSPIDVDFDPDGSPLVLSRTDDRVAVSIAGEPITLPADWPVPAWQPDILRRLNPFDLLLADTRSGQAVVANRDQLGQPPLAVFLLGQGVATVCITPRAIVVGYQEECVLSDAAIGTPTAEVVAAFRHNGTLRDGWRRSSTISSEAFDVYAIGPMLTADGEATPDVLVHAYPGLGATRWDLTRGEAESQPMPQAMDGARAILQIGSILYTHSCYRNRRGLFRYDTRDPAADDAVQTLDELRGPVVFRAARVVQFTKRAVVVRTIEQRSE